MGSFYVNYTVRSADQPAVVKSLTASTTSTKESYRKGLSPDDLVKV